MQQNTLTNSFCRHYRHVAAHLIIRFLLSVVALLFSCVSYSQVAETALPPDTTVVADSLKKEIATCINKYFSDYKRVAMTSLPVGMDSFACSFSEKTLNIFAQEGFVARVFTEQTVGEIYEELSKRLPVYCDGFKIKVYGYNTEIERLVPNLYATEKDPSRLWPTARQKGNGWVCNMSRPNAIKKGLKGTHLAVTPSHGRYYDHQKKIWKWQRPNLYCTTEDMFTRSFVVPYIIPMLENAGAIVFSARERDQHSTETIVDNDSDNIRQDGSYREVTGSRHFKTLKETGFKLTSDIYSTNRNPHTQGTARVIKTQSGSDKHSAAYWTPEIPADGNYALYVSYPTLHNSVEDARYIVCHNGIKTEIRVNQKMGGSMWVYLGTFGFSKGDGSANYVCLTNESDFNGVVCADAIRIGGGMGNIERDGTVSGLHRFLEGAKYYTQWLGLPYEVYNTKDEQHDYADDINCRSNAINYLAGGSAYLPDTAGLKVPLELSVAVHSDAGFRTDDNVVGTLAISTLTGDRQTDTFLSGTSRLASSDLASIMQDEICRDLSFALGKDWTRRELYNRNYSESRKPEVPSMILEMLSHQNFRDMLYGHDPNFKFLLSRAVYKAIVRFVATQHQREYVIQPLPVNGFAAITNGDSVALFWKPTIDSLEPSATPDGYIIYISVDGKDFDNGQLVANGKTTVVLPVEKDKTYRFKVTACNDGGESFPSEILSALSSSSEEYRVLVVNGFTRLSAPATTSTDAELGFDLQKDIGVSYINTSEYCGAQQGFQRTQIGSTETDGLGISGSELEGSVIAGNSFDYPNIHAKAIREANKNCSVSSCSMDFFIKNEDATNAHQLTDIIFGLQRDVNKSSIYPYKTFTPELQQRIGNLIESGNSIFISGSYIGSDMQSETERRFTKENLCYEVLQQCCPPKIVMNTDSISLNTEYNPTNYAVKHVDVLTPTTMAETFVTYVDGSCAGVATPGSVVLGFPFESISEHSSRVLIMRRILQKLILRQ